MNLHNNEVLPRPEYPRPQFVRDSWINLNGTWEFEIDNGNSGKDRELFLADHLSSRIIVPFCPESRLSGIGYRDFLSAIWYRRTFEIPQEWLGQRVLLHFGAVDYETEVWVNGKKAGCHKGGYASFSFEITKMITQGTNIVIVYAQDDLRSGSQPRGKQSRKYHSYECEYTRTTGIWQTVWLEAVPQSYIISCKYFPDPKNGCLWIDAKVIGNSGRLELQAEAYFQQNQVGEEIVEISGSQGHLRVALSERHLWQPGDPQLYDLILKLYDGETIIDTVKSYFGLRSITLSDTAVLINDRPIFQRLVLDQGFYPDGIYTAPTDDDLRHDIEISMAMGFNGARLHQKVFEARFLYWADHLGYIVWGEHADTGLDKTSAAAIEGFLPEWLQIVQRDFNSPAIVTWCPFNETRDAPNGCQQDDELLRLIYFVTKSLDPTRPVVDASGFIHVITDIFDIHDYEQDPDKFRMKFETMETDGNVYNTHPGRQKYEGQPYFVSEYGGTWWNPGIQQEGQMFYGSKPESEDAFLNRYKALTSVLLENPRICGFCYTQLYDVEQEVNGLYTYYRKAKFPPERIKAVNESPAEIEKKNL